MDISMYDEVPKDLTPLEEELLVLKKRDMMLKRAEKEMIEIEEEEEKWVLEKEVYPLY